MHIIIENEMKIWKINDKVYAQHKLMVKSSIIHRERLIVAHI